MKTLTKEIPVKTELKLKLIGVGLILVSFLLFMLPEWGIGATDEVAFGLFWINYSLTAVYFVAMLSQGVFSFKRPFRHIEYLYLYLVLFIISCYSLNRQMSIFQDSVPWLEAFITLFCVSLMAYSFRERLPKRLNQGLLFILGAGSIIWVYYAVYLLPLYIISIFGVLALGISLHTYVPLWVVVALGFGVYKATSEDRQYLRSFMAGASFPILFDIFYIWQWQNRNEQITFSGNDYVIQENETLPRWINLSQQLPADYLTERIMKTDLVYQVPTGEFSMWEMPRDNFDEVKRHDPLVILSVLLLGEPGLDRKEKIKILESMYDARHQAEERLWSGNNLRTANVVSQVRIYPNYRLAYTEKVLRVHNNMAHSSNQQEAIYTFFLPEGSVVSSLSLWINGREEKGYLTTKSKAQTAYKTIVGVEARDPSVVHWQEGNRVSVRVFPCTPEEERQFKIGVTSPLQQRGNSLVYDNIYFTGPSTLGATETSVVHVDDNVSGLKLPSDYKLTRSNEYKRQGNYSQDWSLQFSTPALASGSFSFAGNNYKITELPQQLVPFAPQQLYLDINASWSESEFNRVWETVQQKQVYVWDGKMVQLNQQNKAELFGLLQQRNYSLFPLHKIKNPEQALVISKSNGISPNLSDLKDTPFAEEMADALLQQSTIRIFSLGQQLSPYFKSLKELHVIAPMYGDTKQLATLLQQQQFINTTIDQNTVRLGESGLAIVKENTTIAGGTAPDHLLRLFAYNHVLQQIGARYFSKDFIEDALIAEATQANIVSPVSSLIVLETQADYERFDIQKSKDSLGNASMNGSGAVPEPEEWALIFLAALIIGYFTLKPYFLR
ncbi:XrtN system VIT domain-containing protein [Pontibacter sp. BT310]|uniref:XrtN system VIT domain-containing protein n=1 Tax=Pontibacter populi TaxID=890055 RepID=A0ABS6XFJ2_9BACT|nr:MULTISPECIES: XrtN system VIT domain-containing protein [Pontibacter]MBJ6119032.1 XrtN system VIT domain-containing protein [Pontibacter sp. BT310]MBR0571460.1 XrtN system VIT domain-containing protein [Microvirga sp. STS03]MBW3365886.1 XrtN system VIT domain-containing protein [Pontibacter populi]